MRIEVLPPGKGLVLIARTKPDDSAPVFGAAAGRRRQAAGQGRARRRPSRARRPAPEPAAGCWSPSTASSGAHGAEATYTVTPFTLATLAPAGKPHVFHTDAAGDLKSPPVRVIGFFDGYTRILAERAGAYDKAADVRDRPRKTVIDALTGKTARRGRDPRPAGVGGHRPAAARPSRASRCSSTSIKTGRVSM